MREEKLRVEKVCFQYSQQAKRILNEISFSIHSGEWIAILGPNGSGKSTMAKILNGLLLPDSGSILINGTLPINEENIWEVRKQIGMVFQNPDNQFVGTTVQDDIAFGLENLGIEREEMKCRVEESLKVVGMESFKDIEPHALSGGQKQRVAIAAVLAMQPSILVLDEATSMLDPLGRKDITEMIQLLVKEKQLTVLSITHDLEEAILADRILVFNDGQCIMDDKPAQIFQQGERLMQIGLDVPFATKLSMELKEKGIPLEQNQIDIQGLVRELWKLHLMK
ncbi:MAG: energy-coupling factor ABC transporter ATP-binding protein [Bacillaceae bacterium]